MAPVEGGAHWLETMTDQGDTRQRLDFDLRSLIVGQFALAADDDLIALVVYGETNTEIHVGRLSEGASSLRVLELSFSGATSPAFSPDGTRLALQGGEGANTEIYVVDLESGEASAITNDPGSVACSPTWNEAPLNLVAARPAPAPGELTAFELGAIAPGPVLNEVVDPPMQMTFPEGWFSRRSYVDGWSVYRADEAYGEVDYARLQFGSTDACGEGDLIAIGTTPAEILAGLQARDDLVLEGAGPINLGGYSGISVSVSGKEGEGCGDPEFAYWSLFRTAEDSLSLGPDEHMRLVSLDVGGSPKSFLIFAFSEDIDTYWTEKARPLLETISFPE
jgi:hypothetical protein